MNNWIIFVFLLLNYITGVSCRNIGDDPAPYDNSNYEDSGDGSDETESTEVANIDLDLNRDYLSTIPQAYRIIYPKQSRRNVVQDTLSTLDPRGKGKGSHYSHATFGFTVFEKVVKIRLKLNKELLSRGLKQKTTLETKTSVIEEGSPESCYYQGSIRKVPQSYAAFTTCQNGLSGVLYMNNISYIVEPLMIRSDGNETFYPHVIYKTVQGPQKTCGNDHGMWTPYQQLHKGEFLRRVKINRSNKSDLELLSNFKFIDLGLVMDHAMYEKFNWSYSTTWTYANQLANIIDLFLQEYKICINLIFTEVWNLQNQMPITASVKETLQNFMVYRQKTMKLLDLDATIFITGSERWAGEVGMSVPDSVCTDRSVAVVQDTDLTDRLQVAAAVTHMIAHMLGINHDQHQSCMCEESFGCIMDHNPIGSERIHPFHLSSCSQRDLNGSIQAGLGLCLHKDNKQTSFLQQCGNGVVERGEECDCGSVQNCENTEPCCDPATCLVRPWATCTGAPGEDCCYNCTVLPKTQMCRAPMTDCDVPEFCDGLSGVCPDNIKVQDGQPCKEGASYCYRGYCNTYVGQCKTIWGQSAVASEDSCYEKFNPTGTFNGHCGFNSSINSYIKCAEQNIKCGLVHCAEGNSEPRFGTENTHSHTTIVSEGKKFECKILNDILEKTSPFGLVRDGTKCKENSMCLSGKCVPIATITTETCPTGVNGKLCSGKGLCTSKARCFCFHKYSGTSCEIMTTEATSTPKSTTPVVSRDDSVNVTVPVLAVLPDRPSVDTTASVILQDNETTTLLLIILGGVAAGACLLLCCCLLCYRRRSPSRLKKKLPKNKFSDSDIGERSERVISFGNLPSYRNEKMRRILRSKHKSVGSQSETGSELSAVDRGSRELGIPNLPSPPEKGILKKNNKQGRSLDNLRKNSTKLCPPAEAMELQPLRNTFDPPRHRWLHSYGLFGVRPPKVLSEGDLSPSKGEETTVLMRQTDVDFDHGNVYIGGTDAGEGIYEGLRDSFYKYQSDKPGQEDPYDSLSNLRNSNYNAPDDRSISDNEVVDIGENFEICSQCSGNSIEKHSCNSNSELDLSDIDDLEPEDSRDVQTQTDELVSPLSIKSIVREDSKDSLEGTKNQINKLKNINDLLKQIDEQFDSVLKQTQNQHACDTSPANSEDLRCSETEADRQYGDSYYKQTDLEEAPSSRSSYVSSNAPSTSAKGVFRNSSRVTSSNISSPDPLPSPGCIVSPIAGEHSSRISSLFSNDDNDYSCGNMQRHSTPIGKGDPSKYKKLKSAEGSPVDETKTNTPTSPMSNNPRRKSSPSRIPVLKSSGKKLSPDRNLQKKEDEPIYATPIKIKSPSRNDQGIGDKTKEPSSPWKQGIPHHTTSTPISSPQSPRGRPDILTAVPYRGAKSPSSIPSSPSKSLNKPNKLDLQGIHQLTRSMSAVETGGQVKPKPAPRGLPYQRQLTDPTLDGYPFRPSASGDLHSLSEGYHSDSKTGDSQSKSDIEDSVIVREIPQKPHNLNLKSPARNSKYISSPEDINV